MATIKIEFEKQENTGIPEEDLNYRVKVNVDGGIPLQVAINALVNYLDQLIQFSNEKKNNLHLVEPQATQENS